MTTKTSQRRLTPPDPIARPAKPVSLVKAYVTGSTYRER